MTCPNCGKKIRDGQLLCSNCGTELQLIPDFDPKMENEIQDSLQDLNILDMDDEDDGFAGDDAYGEDSPYGGDAPYGDDASYAEDYPYDDGAYADETYDDAADDDIILYDRDGEAYYEDEEEYLDDFDEEYEGDELADFDDDEDVMHQLVLAIRESRFRWVFLALILLLIVGIIVGASKISKLLYHENSQSYQTQLAKEAAESGDYAKAIEYMEKALTLDSEDSSLKFTLVDYYFANSEEDKAILMLWEIIYSKDINAQLAYRRMIEYYAERKDFSMIEEILSNCDDSTVLTQFAEYTAPPPEFSEEPGSYENVVWLKLSAPGGGNIYYTLDGTDPTTDSELYTSPLYLEVGIINVRAIYVNSYGIASEIADGRFTIDIRKPDAPVVKPAGGVFTEPELISAEAQKYCRIFYTTDGRAPTDQSTEYLSPVPMPLGHSHMVFIAYSQDGIPGEITECDFDLTLETEIDAQSFIDLLKQFDINSGKTVDLEGHLPGNISRYTYNVGYALKFEEDIYYLITENVTDMSENSIKTGAYYLGNISTGELYKAVRSEEDQSFSLGELIPPEAMMAPEPMIPDEEG
ncbi:MAG: chitobiase/beta-hexosaminidase C-terminal domain-containing protein [Lachnospiraceae bacterium]|nr:chitobiase/beta-hexosaminidase C-terminal domain-containing protein [Lachnospiraceae bacterium]